MGRVVAIDGPSGVGKSTVAKMLAQRLSFEYLDTGALYRAVALALRRKNISPDSADEAISRALADVSVDFRGEKVFLNGQDVSLEIRTKEAGHYSSVFSARKAVRDFLMPLQRRLSQTRDVVAEGRDMTTVVFPEAWRKFYLDAPARERAKRRYEQMKTGEFPYDFSYDDALKDVLERDERDSSRSIAPLTRGHDAVYIDTAGIPPEEVVKKMLEAIGVK